jgi:hypothetical protein
MNIIKSLFAFLVMLVATLFTASHAQAFALGNHAGGFFLGTLDCTEINKPSTRNLCRENGWLNYDTLSGCSVATNKIVPNSSQAANLKRFQKKIPANSKDSVELRQLPSGGVAAQATSPGRVLGSKAVYEKQIDIRGKTLQSTKTTYDPSGNIVHVKDKLNGGTF